MHVFPVVCLPCSIGESKHPGSKWVPRVTHPIPGGRAFCGTLPGLGAGAVPGKQPAGGRESPPQAPAAGGPAFPPLAADSRRPWAQQSSAAHGPQVRVCPGPEHRDQGTAGPHLFPPHQGHGTTVGLPRDSGPPLARGPGALPQLPERPKQ